jgi:large subunit ribosomal protein L28
MSYACEICNKGKQYGHNVSFSQRKTGKVWKPNLQRQTIELDGTRLQVKICTQCLRTLKKYEAKAAEKAALAETVKPEPKTKAKTAAKA